MAALAYAPKIREKGLIPLDAGMAVFSKHFLSFTVVYSVEFLLDKCMDQLTGDLWEVLEDVPVLSSLKSLSTLPPVQRVAKDLMSTMFDAVIFYIIRFTKATVKDDMTTVGDALKLYLYSLPSILVASVTNMVVFYVLPIVFRWIAFIWLLMNDGLVAGLFKIVLMYPIFLIFEKVISEPIQTVVLVSHFSAKIKEGVREDEQSDTIRKIVMSVLQELGLIDAQEDGEESDNSEEETDCESTIEEQSKREESTEDVEVPETAEEEQPSYDKEEEVWAQYLAAVNSKPKITAPTLDSIVKFQKQNEESTQRIDIEDDPVSESIPIVEEQESFLTKTSKIFGSVDFTMLNKTLEDDTPSDSRGMSSLFGGGGDDEFD